jgi:hypothetical protein
MGSFRLEKILYLWLWKGLGHSSHCFSFPVEVLGMRCELSPQQELSKDNSEVPFCLSFLRVVPWNAEGCSVLLSVVPQTPFLCTLLASVVRSADVSVDQGSQSLELCDLFFSSVFQDPKDPND